MARALSVLVAVGLAACEGASRPGDTSGTQTYGRWEWHGRLVVQPDPTLTLTRIRIDTGVSGGEDVVLVRYDFNPSPALGDEYALTLGLELGRARALRLGVAYPMGGPHAAVPAYATVACLCAPLREDSIRGTFFLVTRGLRQLTGRLDAALYFSEWNDPAHHATYALHQRFDALK